VIVQRVGIDAHTMDPTVIVVMNVQAGTVFAFRHDGLVWTFLAQLETGPVVVVTDLVAVTTNHLFPVRAIDLFVGTVDGDNSEIVIDDDKGPFVTVNERLEVDFSFSVH
jgi:hypothetical protein